MGRPWSASPQLRAPGTRRPGAQAEVPGGTSPGGLPPPPPPRAGLYPPYRLCALCFEFQGGPKERTTAGLNRAALMKNRRDKVVSKKYSTTGKRAYNHIQTWTQSAKSARKANKVASPVKKTSSPKLLRVG